MSAPVRAPLAWASRDIATQAGAGRVTLLSALVGRYTLDIHDATGSSGCIHIAMWSVTDRGARLAEGVADSLEAAKRAAEQEARRRLAEASGTELPAMCEAFAAQSSITLPGESGEHTTDPALVTAPPLAASGSDAAIIAAYADFMRLQQEMARGGRLPDDEFTVLSNRSDAACDAALAVDPVTALGMAIQVHMAFHLAFGGTRADPMAVSYPEEDEEFNHLRPICDRAFRLTADLRLAGGAA